MIVRREDPADRDAISRVHREAFDGHLEARLVERLREEEKDRYGPSLVAEVDGRAVGHLLLTRVGLVGDAPRQVLALIPMGVLPDHQRRGIGSALIRAAQEEAELPIVLLGHVDFYSRFGFAPATPYGMRSTYDDTGDHWMVWFPPGIDPAAWAGEVVYPPAFDGV